MTSTFSSEVTRKLAFRLILDSIDYRKRCIKLQEIIRQSKTYEFWRKTLIEYTQAPLQSHYFKPINKN